MIKPKVLFLCTANRCRTQMAEAFLRDLAGDRFDVSSAGYEEAPEICPDAVAVMRELGIDISGHRSKHVDEFEGQRFDYVITVCDNAKESCPVFFGAVKRLHHSFDDPPPMSQGTDDERMAIFRRVRGELRAYLREFAQKDSPET
jgi:arsenate reductase